jgi:hypothetical protein
LYNYFIIYDIKYFFSIKIIKQFRGRNFFSEEINYRNHYLKALFFIIQGEQLPPKRLKPYGPPPWWWMSRGGPSLKKRQRGGAGSREGCPWGRKRHREGRGFQCEESGGGGNVMVCRGRPSIIQEGQLSLRILKNSAFR